MQLDRGRRIPGPRRPGVVGRKSASLLLAVAAWSGGCSDPGPIGPEDGGLDGQGGVVSNSVLQDRLSLVITRTGARGAEATQSVAAQGTGDPIRVAYASLPSGSVPTGTVASIRNTSGAGRLVVTIVDGGFDPVAVPAVAGDILEIEVELSGGGTQLSSVRVPARRPPRVVRTYPPPRKRDVALNAGIVVVFTEPVAAASLTPSTVRLLRGPVAQAGSVRLLDGSGLAALFTPATPLEPQTAYRLEVTTGVTDLDGEALERAVTLDFTTGDESVGPPASIHVIPDSLLMLVVGSTYQLTATVRDDAGNVLVDREVTWSTSDVSGLTVSPSGLVRALGDGAYRLTASVGTVSKVLAVWVQGLPPASISLAPTPAAVARNDTVVVTATVRDATGRLINGATVTWTSNAALVATVEQTSLPKVAAVIGQKEGTATITATSGSVSQSALVTVGPPVPVASIAVAPATAVPEGTAQMTAILRDAAGRVIGNRVVEWTSDNGAVATVDATGLLTAVSTGSANITATSDAARGTATVTVAPVRFVSVSAAGPDDWNHGTVYGGHTCALTEDGVAYCWGGRPTGFSGTDHWVVQTTAPSALGGDVRFARAVAGGYLSCGLTREGTVFCWNAGERAPVSLEAGPRFTTLTAAQGGPMFVGGHVCGLTTSGAAYCWGSNLFGQLGVARSGLMPAESVPVAVIGGLTFSTVQAGGYHSCGLTTTGAAYCWGDNTWQTLGNGTTGGLSWAPVPVTGGLTFIALAAATYASCGLSADGATYCWGLQYGPVPAPLAGGLAFTALSGGVSHFCGLTASGAAYCWRTGASTPEAVPGGLTFSSVSAGGDYTCGITTSGLTYCWGKNNTGQLGNASTSDSSVPVRVTGQP
jgi:alpha-tubulin suppressor-like RCC1 family protein/uncharacterized protein YjdB